MLHIVERLPGIEHGKYSIRDMLVFVVMHFYHINCGLLAAFAFIRDRG